MKRVKYFEKNKRKAWISWERERTQFFLKITLVCASRCFNQREKAKICGKVTDFAEISRFWVIYQWTEMNCFQRNLKKMSWLICSSDRKRWLFVFENSLKIHSMEFYFQEYLEKISSLKSLISFQWKKIWLKIIFKICGKIATKIKNQMIGRLKIEKMD